MANDDNSIDRARQVPDEPQVNALYLRGLRDYLRQRGLDTAALMARFELDEALFDEPRRRLPAGLYEQLMVAAGELAGDADVGLHVGECIRPGHYGVLGFACMACREVSEVFRRHQRYETLVANIGVSRYEAHGDQMHLIWDTGTGHFHRVVFDETLASWVTFARWLVSEPLSPTRIRFPYPRPNNIEAHQRIFACEIEFDAPLAEVVFPVAYLSLPLAQSDPELSRLMERRAEVELASLDDDEWIGRVRRQIMDLLAEGEVSLKQVAQRLEMSERAVQRRLQERGFSYQQVLEDTRRTLALEYVSNPTLTLAEVAFLLGFADQSAFNRAFRSWTGETPGQYRRRHADS